MREIAFSIDPASAPENSRSSTDVDLSALMPDQDLSPDLMVYLQAANALNSGVIYCGCRITATGTLRMYFASIQGNPVDAGTVDFMGYVFSPGEFKHQAVSLTPGQIGANLWLKQDVTLSFVDDLTPDECVIISPPDDLASSLAYVGHRIPMTNTLSVHIGNMSDSPVQDNARTWDVYILHGWEHASFTWNPASIANQTRVGQTVVQTFQSQLIAPGMPVVFYPSSILDTQLFYGGGSLQRINTFQVELGNINPGSAVDDVEQTWEVCWKSFGRDSSLIEAEIQADLAFARIA